MKYFLSDDVWPAVERGEQLMESELWGGVTEHSGAPVFWLGARPATWLVIADILHKSGAPGQAIAAGIAYRFGMKLKT